MRSFAGACASAVHAAEQKSWKWDTPKDTQERTRTHTKRREHGEASMHVKLQMVN